MQNETKLNIYELLLLTPEEANKLFSKEFWKEKPDLELIGDILAYSPVDVNLQDRYGWTALMRAANKEEYIELLLNHPGIDVNVQTESGTTALMWAAYNENEKVVELLLNHPGIDITLKNKGGNTALDLIDKRTKLAKLLKQKMNS
jgi:ankyrin repeat protein